MKNVKFCTIYILACLGQSLVWFKLEKRKIRVTIRLEKVKGKRISMIT
jgi:hypothetical protein